MPDTTEAAGSAADIARAEAEAELEQTRPAGEPETGPVEAGEEFPGGTEERAREMARKAREARESGESAVLHVVDDPSIEARDRGATNTATEEDWDEVTAWLLNDEAEVITRQMWVRVGGDDENPKVLPWGIKAIPMQVIKQAEREASQQGGNRAARRGGAGPQQYDDVKANLRVIVEGTIKPDLKGIAQQKDIRDPTVLLQKRFAFRPGVLAQLAGEIMSISGFDDADVQAAGN